MSIKDNDGFFDLEALLSNLPTEFASIAAEELVEDFEQAKEIESEVYSVMGDS